MTEAKKFKILVTNETDHLPQSRAILEECAEVIYRPNPTDEELLELIADVDAIVTNLSQRITPKVIDTAKRLKIISTPSTGTDHIDIEYAENKGILVQSIKKDYDVLKKITSTAEHAFLLMMACLRKLPFAFDAVRRGEWTRSEYRGREVEGRVVGILGYGRLGEMFSRFAKGFDMKVIACDPFKNVTDDWVEQVEFDELLARAEIITIHVHLTDETRNMINRDVFNKMRDGVYLVNTSRGGLIDEEAFIEALESGKIMCAGIDVLANELDGDIINEPLVKYAQTHSNLIISPHIGGCSYDAQEKSYKHTATKLINALKEL